MRAKQGVQGNPVNSETTRINQFVPPPPRESNKSFFRKMQDLMHGYIVADWRICAKHLIQQHPARPAPRPFLEMAETVNKRAIAPSNRAASCPDALARSRCDGCTRTFHHVDVKVRSLKTTERLSSETSPPYERE